MNIKIGMPEILVIFSLMIFTHSYRFSFIAFVLGIFAIIIQYLIDYSEKLKKAETLSNSVEEAQEVLKDLFNVKKD